MKYQSGPQPLPKLLTLSKFVKHRNGVALGAPDSMRNMLTRSLGAGSFDRFWQYWNPIWGYYLSTKVMKPLLKIFPLWLSIILTFAVSGALHDLAIALVKLKPIVFFTPWFTLMGLMVVISKKYSLTYQQRPFVIRALINLTTIIVCYILTDRAIYKLITF